MYVIFFFMVFLGDLSVDVVVMVVDVLGYTVKIFEFAEYVKVICRLLYFVYRVLELQKFYLCGVICMLENLRIYYEFYGDFDDWLVCRGEAVDLGVLYFIVFLLVQVCIILRCDV